VDRGISGAKDRRPALDALVKDAKRRRFDVLVCWRLDRLGRNLRHLILFLDELSAVGAAFISLQEGIDATTPLAGSAAIGAGGGGLLWAASRRGSIADRKIHAAQILALFARKSDGPQAKAERTTARKRRQCS